jgi:LicD family/Glycosyl transferase family 2
MTKFIVSLHDQATELYYPAGLQSFIDLLFGSQTQNPPRRPAHTISVREVGSNRYSVRFDQRAVGEGYGIPELLDVLLEEVVRSLIFELDTAVALHGASIAWQGKSVLIPGPTGAGKTSLTGWFAAMDFEFLSDELVILPGGGRTTLSFPRPLLAKPGAEELLALLKGRARFVPTGANTLIGFDQPSPHGNQVRQAGLMIFPNFVAGSPLEFVSVSPAQSGMKLMQCNLNARNLDDHGLRSLTAFARNVPALDLIYGGYEQLEGVADTFVKFILENDVTVAGLQNISSALRPRSYSIGKSPPATTPAKVAIPEATPRKAPKKVTIGMATFDDYDGVYFSLQAIRFYHPEILDDVEFIVIDNHPDGPCGQALKALENSIPNYRYVPKTNMSGTAIRDCVFEEASGEIVLCMDCHVFISQGALQRLIAYFDAHPGSKDLLQGPLIYDDLRGISTHLKPEWRSGMYGTWHTTPAGADPDSMPFEITMQGLGLFACRRDAWPGFNPAFRGFGGEEGYIHEKFRQRGGRVICLPFLRWLHRFNRPMGVPYPNRWEDRIQNYLIGFRELAWNTAPIAEHFKTVLGAETATRVIAQLEEELALSGNTDAGIARATASPEDHFASKWDESALAQQRNLLARIAAVAETHKLALYLFWGTLLGHVREGGILPWDDDVDLALFDPDADRYAAFRAAIEAAGLRIFDKTQNSDVWIKICDPASPVQSHKVSWTWPFVDIYIYSTAPKTSDGAWPALAWPRQQVLPGRLTTFEGVSCWEPEQPLALLDLQYSGWRNLEESSVWNHRWEAYNDGVSTRSIVTDAAGRKIVSHPAEHENPLGRPIFLPLLREWINLTRRHDIRYSIFWGTLLGQVRNQRIIPYDWDIDVVVGKSGLEALYALPGQVPNCVFNDELKDQPAWKENEIRLVVRRDLASSDGPRYDHRGRRVSTQVDSCAFNGPLARLIIKLPELLYGRNYWHLDVDMFTDISRFNPYPAVHEVDELPELEGRLLEGLQVSCLKDPLPYITQYYGADYMIPDHVYRDGRWVQRTS